MGPSSGRAAFKAFAACLVVATHAHAEYTVTGPHDVTTLGPMPPPNGSVGDIEPGLVSLDNGRVALAWLRIPTPGHLGGSTELLSVVFDPDASAAITPSPIDVASYYPTALGLTTDGTDVLAIYAGPTTASSQDWHVSLQAVTRAMRGSTQLLPSNGHQLPNGQNVLTISVPDRVGGTLGFEIPFAITTSGDAGSRTLVSTSAQVGPTLALTSSTSSQRVAAGPGAIERASHFTGIPRGLFFDLDPAMRSLVVHDVTGGFASMFSTTSTSYGGVGVSDARALFVVSGAEITDRTNTLHCRETESATRAPIEFACPATPIALDEIALAADPTVFDTMWIVGTNRTTPSVFVGSTSLLDVPTTLAAPGFSGCSHPAVAAFRGVAAGPGRVAVAATCTPTLGGPAHVLRWIVERPVMFADGGVDAATDSAVADANIPSDVPTPNDVIGSTDASIPSTDGSTDVTATPDSVSVGSGRTGPSFRGSGCSCRTERTHSRPQLAWLALLGVLVSRRRVRRLIRAS